ncbi:hypothetical protein [Burkholderia sp. LAS2]|uniref:hypothetical protein n=1 Tax=Burkholderia sp. LAS2 TaxID=2813843 RepID=UPI001BCE27C5|nr:hypothetical protein [Burkholderia sp. LAS2]QVN12032.1 hypothetical protein JYG37_02150 [Burkholderia sp. LAS2]
MLTEGDFWPMIYIDGKRPYGNRTDHQFDIAELMGEPYRRDTKGDLVTDGKGCASGMSACDMLAALQVFLMRSDPSKPA